MRVAMAIATTMILVQLVQVNRAVAQTDEAVLVCEGTYYEPGGVETPIMGITIALRSDTVTIESAGFFRGEYVITNTLEQLIFFGSVTPSGEPSTELQGTLNRFSGVLNLIHMDPERWFRKVDARCRTANRLF